MGRVTSIPSRCCSAMNYSFCQERIVPTSASSSGQPFLLQSNSQGFPLLEFSGTSRHPFLYVTLKLLRWAGEEYGAPVGSTEHFHWRFPHVPCPKLSLINSHRPCTSEDISRCPRQTLDLLTTVHIQWSPSLYSSVSHGGFVSHSLLPNLIGTYLGLASFTSSITEQPRTSPLAFKSRILSPLLSGTLPWRFHF